MMETVCIFEDSHYKKLFPIVWTRAVYEILLGTELLLNKIIYQYKNSNIYLYCRDYIEPVLKERYKYPVNDKIKSNKCLFINGRALIKEKIKFSSEQEIGVKEDVLVYAILEKENIEILKPETILLGSQILKKLQEKNIKIKKVNFDLVTYPWDLIEKNPKEIISDFGQVTKKNKIEGEIYKGVNILNKSQIYIGKGSKIKPGVVLDAEKGPIYIGKNVVIEPNSVIQGPVFIGDNSIIRPLSIIKEGTTIGGCSRIGGEITNSIIQGYSNKQHFGFLGHSYIGMWCNLGAGTNNSDLKNNYSSVKVYVEGKKRDTGLRFLGLIMADHSKSSIGTQFNTGTVVGVSCNIFGQGFPPKYIPSFSWVDTKELKEYDLDKAIKTAKIVMSRRNKDLSSSEEKLLRDVFNMTQKERISNPR